MDISRGWMLVWSTGALAQDIVLAVALVLLLNGVNVKSFRSVAFALLRVAGITFVTVCLQIAYHAFGWARYIGSPLLGDPLSQIIVGVIYAIFFCKYIWQTRVLLCGTLLVSSFALHFAGEDVCKLLDYVMVEPPLHLMKTLSMLLIMVVTFVMYRFHLNRFDTVSGINVISPVVVYVLCFVILLLIQIAPSLTRTYEAFTVTTEFSLYAITIMVYFMVYFFCNEHSEKLLLQTEKDLAVANEQLVSISEQNLKEMRELRHELKNQYAYMCVLIEEDKHDELISYFKQARREILDKTSYVDCGNKIVSSIVTMKKARAESMGIKLDCSICVPPKLPIPDVDLCSALSNVLDNAIEAVDRYGTKEGVVGVQIYQSGDYFYIVVDNPVPADVNVRKILNLVTSKEDKKQHGYGTKIVRRIAEKYKGAAIFDIREGRFVAKLMLEACETENK